MKFTSTIGKHLKSDDVIEILEAYDMPVTYDFDRSHENIEDAYWAGSKENGFLFRFNQAQTLDTIFLYMAPSEGYLAIERSDVDVPIYDTFQQAQRACVESGVPNTQREGVSGNPEHRWIKLDFGTHTVHYQYPHRQLDRITIGLQEPSRAES